MQTVTLGRGGPLVSRIGLGMAALGRPAYITTGRAADFGEDRSEDAFRRRSWEVLDAAYAAGSATSTAPARMGRPRPSWPAGWPAPTRPTWWSAPSGATPTSAPGTRRRRCTRSRTTRWRPSSASTPRPSPCSAPTSACTRSTPRPWSPGCSTTGPSMRPWRGSATAVCVSASRPRARLRPRPSGGRWRSEPGASRSSARCRRPGTCWSRRSSPPWSRPPRPGGR